MSEAPITTFVRGTVLLAILIALPGIAVCWNLLPKDLWSKSVSSPVATKTEQKQAFRDDFNESAMSLSLFAPESVARSLPEPQAMYAPIAPPLASSPLTSPVPAIQQVSWEHSRAELPQDFASLGLRLEALGSTYYKIEKWGNRGELFRVSCFVALSENHSHTKHFQAIGSDVVAAMQTVIADIERWKNGR